MLTVKQFDQHLLLLLLLLPECNGDGRPGRVIALGHHLGVGLTDPAGVVLLLADVVHDVLLVILRPPGTSDPAPSSSTGADYVQLVKLER